MDKAMGLKIKTEALVEHLNCPVCMNRLRSTQMTPCGHRYCEGCIVEWINLRHRCPCCNAALERNQLIKDAQFDNLIETITKEESSAETFYFDSLISAAAQNAFQSDDLASAQTEMNEAEVRAFFSPVEQVLKEHLKRSLVSHEKFYQDLQREHRRRQNAVDSELHQSIALLTDRRLPADEEARQRQVLEAEATRSKAALTEDLTRCTKLVAGAYDKYLSEHIPDLSILPVSVGISLLDKGLQISDIKLQPQDSLDDVQKFVCEHMKKNGDNIVEFADDVKFLCFSPFAKRSLYEMRAIATDIVERGASSADIELLPRGCRPVIQGAVRPGSEIAIYGTIRCESDMPKQCFATTFRPEENKTMDYFSCKNCSAKWICRPCMDVCHKDHQVVPYIMNHQPTWACCYCSKKKKCMIQTVV